MVWLLKLIAVAGLFLTVVPAFLVAMGTLALDTSKTCMLVGMILWFASAPLIRRRQPNKS